MEYRAGQTPFFLKLRSLKDSFTRSEKVAADHLLEHAEQVVEMKLSGFSGASGVSEATIIRLCRLLGYDGFTDMKLDLVRSLATARLEGEADDVHPTLSCDTPLSEIPVSIIQQSIIALEGTAKMFKTEAYVQAVELIRRANNLFLFGVANSASVADDAMNKFVRLGKRCVVASDTHLQISTAATLNPDDVVIGISHSGRTRETIDALRLAKKSNAKIISISNYEASLISELADVCLLTADYERSFFTETMASRICQLAIIDMLYMGVLFADYERNFALLQRINSELASHSL